VYETYKTSITIFSSILKNIITKPIPIENASIVVQNYKKNCLQCCVNSSQFEGKVRN